MNKSSDLPLYLSTYKLLLYLYKLTVNFPKSYKYSLGNDLLSLCWDVLDNIILANSLPNEKKSEVIRLASISFDKLKVRLRLAHEIKLINHKKFSFLIEKNAEIGKMLAGWLNWSEKAGTNL